MQYAGCKIIFFDAGVYVVTDTIEIPAGTQVVGEAWSVIAGTGNSFGDYANPKVVVRVGDPGSTGVTEITDMIFTTHGPSTYLLSPAFAPLSELSSSRWRYHRRMERS